MDITFWSLFLLGLFGFSLYPLAVTFANKTTFVSKQEYEQCASQLGITTLLFCILLVILFKG